MVGVQMVNELIIVKAGPDQLADCSLEHGLHLGLLVYARSHEVLHHVLAAVHEEAGVHGGRALDPLPRPPPEVERGLVLWHAHENGRDELLAQLGGKLHEAQGLRKDQRTLPILLLLLQQVVEDNRPCSSLFLPAHLRLVPEVGRDRWIVD